MQPKPKKGTSSDGKDMHYSVGALIEKDGKYLLIERKIFPPGFAGLAGHVDEGEDEIQALIREVEEESGLKVEKYKKLFEEEVQNNECVYGIKVHYWYLFSCEVSGKVVMDDHESKSIDWYTKEQIQELNKKNKLEPVWKYWFEKLKIL